MRAAVLFLVLMAAAGCSDGDGDDVATSDGLTAAEQSFVDAWSPRIPAEPGILVADAREVCANAGQPDSSAFPLLIGNDLVDQQNETGEFSRSAVQTLCPELYPTVERAIAFDRLMSAPTTAAPTATTPRPKPTTAPSSGGSAGGWEPEPPGASARCVDGTYIYTEPQRGMCDAHGGTEILYR